VAHDELVDRVVEDLFEHDVDAVGRVGAVTDAADVHPSSQPDVLERVEVWIRLVVAFFARACRLGYASRGSGYHRRHRGACGAGSQNRTGTVIV